MGIFHSYVSHYQRVQYFEAPSYQRAPRRTSPGGPGPRTLLDGDAVDGTLVSRLASSYGNALEDCEGVPRRCQHVSVGGWVSLGPGLLNHIKPLGLMGKYYLSSQLSRFITFEVFLGMSYLISQAEFIRCVIMTYRSIPKHSIRIKLSTLHMDLPKWIDPIWINMIQYWTTVFRMGVWY